MLRNIWTIYRKELIDTLRDRKTLIFMLLLPTVLAPALMFGLSNFAISFVKKQATQEVIIAASAEARDRYVALAHRQFLESSLGKTLKMSRTGVVSFLIGKSASNDLEEQVPAAIFGDAVAYRDWTTGLARRMEDMAREGKGSDFGGKALGGAANASPADTELAKSMAQGVADFYTVSLRGVGLVRFVGEEEIGDGVLQEGDVLPESLVVHERGTAIYTALKARRIHGYLEVVPGGGSEATTTIRLFHDETIPLSREASSRVEKVGRLAGEAIVAERARERKLPAGFLEPVRMERGTNIASQSQVALSALGGMIPYLVLTFAFLGGLYPAIDLGAGEKERNTLETLLLSPATRTEIALGKFLLIFTTSMSAALLGIASMAVSFLHLMPDFVLERLDIRIDIYTALCAGALAIPPAAAFAGLLLAISIYARTFKEAQSYLSPLPIVMVLPASAGLIPGLEINAGLAMVPLVNVSLLSRDVLKGDLHWGYYSLTVLSCLLFAAACVALCVFMFKRESVVFRG